MPEAVYCCFTRTTLFTTMFAVIIMVCLLCFISIGCCVSELHDNLCRYRNVWPEAVYPCNKNYIVYVTFNMPIPWSLWISISTQSFVSQLCLVIEIR